MYIIVIGTTVNSYYKSKSEIVSFFYNIYLV